MARKCNTNPSVRLTITTNKKVIGHLSNLVKLGLHGNTVPEAAERLLCESLLSRMKRRQSILLNEEEE